MNRYDLSETSPATMRKHIDIAKANREHIEGNERRSLCES